jgi:predicted HicB family RNase H-like nuclease
MMQYKGYIAQVEFDDEANVFHGEVSNTRDVITFEGSSVKELRKSFKESIDDYLAFCKERGEKPDKPFSGRVLIRLSPKEHQQIFIAARKSGKSLNSWVKEHLKESVN